jgi:hypothetical protein
MFFKSEQNANYSREMEAIISFFLDSVCLNTTTTLFCFRRKSNKSRKKSRGARNSIRMTMSLFHIAGEKHIVKLLHFPNITPSEQKRLLMSGSDSGSGSDDEHDHNEGVQQQQKPQRKKSSTKRSLDLQRKISQSKLKEERKETKQQTTTTNNTNGNHVSPAPSPNSVPTPAIEIPSVSLKHGRYRMTRNGKMSGGYEQFSKSFLNVPMPKDYCDPSSDDLSSEWDSDSMNDNNNAKTNGAPKESKVRKTRFFTLYARN